eukprot:1156182-Pelagomonas_calceolata.AAC.3
MPLSCQGGCLLKGSGSLGLERWGNEDAHREFEISLAAEEAVLWLHNGRKSIQKIGVQSG